MNLMKRFWTDEAGVIISSELILVVTILVIGLIAGLAALRDAVTMELGDTAAAIGFVEQDYTFLGTTNGGATASTSGSQFNDDTDLGDALDPVLGAGGNGVAITVAASELEGN